MNTTPCCMEPILENTNADVTCERSLMPQHNTGVLPTEDEDRSIGDVSSGKMVHN